jgi:archaellum component FlaC
MIDEKSWENKNRDRSQMSVDEKKRFENLDEDFDDDFENNFKNASFMNTKFVNLHVIFFFSI